MLCPQVAAEQAGKAEHSVQDELELLCTHGILHLLGYDHAEPDEHATMFGLQDQLLASWRATPGAIRPARPGLTASAAQPPGPGRTSGNGTPGGGTRHRGRTARPRLRAGRAGRATRPTGHDGGRGERTGVTRPMGWLLAAAIALTLLAGRCATAEAALARVARAGAQGAGP